MSATALKQTYNRAEVRRLLGVTERQLQSWERVGLLPAAQSFGLAEITVAKTLRDLRKAGVPLAGIQAAVDSIRKRMGSETDPLRDLRLIREGRRLRLEIAGQRIEAQSGQMVFDFDAATLRRLVSFPNTKQISERRTQREQAESWFQKGLELEHSGAPLEEAIAAYENAVKLDAGSAGAWLNLGTIYFNARIWQQAERYYKRALAADANYPLAHFNLGNLYDERGDWAKALHHYGEALRLNPTYADAHYNLALLHQNRGRLLDAVRHWRTYLKLDPTSQWAEIARRELDKLKKTTVVEGGNRLGSASRLNES